MTLSDERKAELRAILKNVTVTEEPDWRGSMTSNIDQMVDHLTELLAGYSVRRKPQSKSPFEMSIASDAASIQAALSQAFALRAALPKTDMFTALGAFGQIDRTYTYFMQTHRFTPVEIDPAVVQAARATLANGRTK